jgi:hypothetical protein
MDLTSAIIGHLVADYLLQFDFIAENKKKNSLICALHCLIWASCVCLLGDIWNVTIFSVLFITHYIQDRWQLIPCYMKTIGQNNFAKPPLAPWSLIVVDNVWHIFTIWIIYKLCINQVFI